MAEKEIRIVKKDGSIHQLPVDYASKLITLGEAKLYSPKKKGKKDKTEESEVKAPEAPKKNKMVSKPKKKK